MNQKVTRKYDEYIYSMLMLSYCLSSLVLAHFVLVKTAAPIQQFSIDLLMPNDRYGEVVILMFFSL
ncbi:hypothetical protein [Vibrio harveyi]|nr:hypothetical protein [Vibrio harveyi]MCQ9072159.1 hypothetical protein [Vibrio harveyi]